MHSHRRLVHSVYCGVDSTGGSASSLESIVGSRVNGKANKDYHVLVAMSRDRQLPI